MLSESKIEDIALLQEQLALTECENQELRVEVQKYKKIIEERFSINNFDYDFYF